MSSVIIGAVIIAIICIGLIIFEVESIYHEKELERRKCIKMMRNAADYSDLEAKSVAYALAQTHPDILLEAILERINENDNNSRRNH